MVFERPHGDPDLPQSLLDGTVSIDGSWFIITIPIDNIGLPFARGFNDFFNRLAATPLERQPSFTQRRCQILKTSQHKIHAGGAEDMGLQERFVENKERDHIVAGFKGRGQGRLIVEPQIPPKPNNPAH